MDSPASTARQVGLSHVAYRSVSHICYGCVDAEILPQLITATGQRHYDRLNEMHLNARLKII